ncbi:hypothetical protein X777_15917 [Ooceraea biroi]|uniref:Uncharacterized protein n=1 Tax=Ooceraea biroi TaxID=2015173 RepID=A0A026WVZ0_OOCBI|nr:hypothetical protein X777_15917 [Ooceraea biroi]
MFPVQLFRSDFSENQCSGTMRTWMLSAQKDDDVVRRFFVVYAVEYFIVHLTFARWADNRSRFYRGAVSTWEKERESLENLRRREFSLNRVRCCRRRLDPLRSARFRDDILENLFHRQFVVDRNPWREHGPRNKSISLNKKGPERGGHRVPLKPRSRSSLLWARQPGSSIVDRVDKLIARDRLIKMPTHWRREPNTEQRKYYSGGAGDALAGSKIAGALKLRIGGVATHPHRASLIVTFTSQRARCTRRARVISMGRFRGGDSTPIIPFRCGSVYIAAAAAICRMDR